MGAVWVAVAIPLVVMLMSIALERMQSVLLDRSTPAAERVSATSNDPAGPAA